MASHLAEWFVSLFSFLTVNTFGKYLTAFIISMFPILELRGGLIAASCFLHLPALSSIFVCMLGNLLPVPFILWFIMPIFDRLKKTKRMKKVVAWAEKKANKRKRTIEDLKYYGLMIFVAIPLPITGAWTGSLIAAMLDMDKKKSILAIFCGLIIASAIMYLVSYKVLGGVCS
jgi:uncharacterized membrane protein